MSRLCEQALPGILWRSQAPSFQFGVSVELKIREVIVPNGSSRVQGGLELEGAIGADRTA